MNKSELKSFLKSIEDAEEKSVAIQILATSEKANVRGESKSTLNRLIHAIKNMHMATSDIKTELIKLINALPS